MTQMHLGWHFCAMQEGKSILRDGSVLEIGRTYEHTGKLRMCESGYHDSERVIDALNYALGPYLCRTISSADKRDTDKRVSRYRVALAGMDATEILHTFAVRIAYCALLREQEQGREPDERSWNALRVKLEWIEGRATDKQLDAARNAARIAAWVAARDAANDLLLSMLPASLINPETQE